jgi:prolyl-tRNA synthetase
MRVSNFFFQTLREAPSDASLASHIFMLRGGYIRQTHAGIYALTPLGLRVVRKIEAIIRKHMDAVGGLEIDLPLVQPAELWQESGRYEAIGDELLRFKDRTGHDMVLAMTHEEAVTDLARGMVNSYKQFPFMLYQFKLKYRDEPRARGGLIRVREFVMKDAYSFHATNEDLDTYYETVYQAYVNIFKDIGIEPIVVQSDTGIMGGKIAHEFMLDVDSGEDYLILCDHCNYQANQEIALFTRATYPDQPALPLTKTATPNSTSIEDVTQLLQAAPSQALKCVFYQSEDGKTLYTVLIRGDLEVSEIKLKNHLKVPTILPAQEELIEQSGMVPGYAGPILDNAPNTIFLADQSLVNATNLITGANEKGFHYTNCNPGRDFAMPVVVDLAQAQAGCACPKCGKELRATRGIELGNIFKLGTKFSESMKLSFLDEQGKAKPAIMGCYGIGVGRLAASAAEKFHDEWGIIWPKSIAPFQVIVVPIGKEEQCIQCAEGVYAQLQQAGYDVLLDDRAERPGVKFKDADLWGIPIRISIGMKSLAENKVEWKLRSEKQMELMALDSVLERVKEYYES